MTIINKHPVGFIGYHKSEGWLDITVPPDMVPEFKVMVQRSINTWQDVSPEMRNFIDRLLERDKVMGTSVIKHNMLAERTRDCCGTMLKEPHHTQCPEKDKVASYRKPLINVIESPCVPEGSALVVQDGKIVATIKNIG